MAMQAESNRRRRARLGVLFAVAAVTVTAPRLALAYLAADGVEVPTSWRIDLLAVSSVATSIVLTGGTAYLAHAIAVALSGRAALVACWVVALGCSGELIAPAIVASLRVQPLAVVLGCLAALELVDMRRARRGPGGLWRHARGRQASNT